MAGSARIKLTDTNVNVTMASLESTARLEYFYKAVKIN